MKIAIPVTGGLLSQHFGHTEAFAILEADPESRSVVGEELVPTPAHEPGVLPAWLKGMGVDVIITGGMGRRALGLFASSGIEVVVGAQSGAPREVATSYLNGKLAAGQNVCDH